MEFWNIDGLRPSYRKYAAAPGTQEHTEALGGSGIEAPLRGEHRMAPVVCRSRASFHRMRRNLDIGGDGSGKGLLAWAVRTERAKRSDISRENSSVQATRHWVYYGAWLFDFVHRAHAEGDRDTRLERFASESPEGPASPEMYSKMSRLAADRGSRTRGEVGRRAARQCQQSDTSPTRGSANRHGVRERP